MIQVPPLTPVSILRCNPLSFLLQQLLREPCILLRELLHTSLKCCFMTSHLLYFPLQASNFLRELSRVLHVPLQASIFLRKARVDTSDLLRKCLALVSPDKQSISAQRGPSIVRHREPSSISRQSDAPTRMVSMKPCVFQWTLPKPYTQVP